MYLLLFGWLLTPLSALADSKVQFLCIELRNGTTAEFALADNPVITLTGGTMKAACDLVKKFKPKKIYANFIIELNSEFPHARDLFDKDVEITSLLKF